MSLKELEEKKEKNREQRREFIKYWARYVRENEDQDWSEQQNLLVNSQIQTVEETDQVMSARD